MVLEVSVGAVGVVSAETNGGGPLGHPVSSASVSRFCGSQKPIFPGKFCKNLKVPPMGNLGTQLRPEGQRRPKSHYQNFEIENFRFSQTCS